MGYHHVGTEVWNTEANGAQEYKVCAPGGEDLTCSDSVLPDNVRALLVIGNRLNSAFPTVELRRPLPLHGRAQGRLLEPWLQSVASSNHLIEVTLFPQPLTEATKNGVVRNGKEKKSRVR